MNWKKIFTIAALTGFSASVATGQGTAPTIVQGDYISNVFGQSNFIKNPNAKLNTKDVTVSNATVTRSTTTPLVATSEFNITTSTSTGYADWATRTFDAGMKNQNCEARFTYRGFSVGSTSIQVRQGSNTVAQLTLTASTDPRIASINFPCGDLSSATTLRVQQATASLTGTNELSGLYLGLATNQANVAQAELVVKARVTTNQALTSTATDVIFNTEDLDVYGEFNTTTGVFTARRAGNYMINAHLGTTYGTWNNSEYFEIQLVKNTTSISSNYNMVEAAVGTRQFVSANANSVALAVGDTIRVKALETSGASYLLDGGVPANYLEIYRFPTSSELVVTPERQNTWGSVNYTGTAGSLTVRSGQVASNTFDTFSGAAFTSARTLKGKCKAPVSGDNVGCQIENMPVGNYEVSISGLMFQDPGTTTVGCSHRIFETTTSTQVASQTASRATSSGGVLYQGRTIKGVFNNTSLANRNFVIQAAKTFVLDGTTQGQCLLFINTSGDISDVNFTITPLDQPSNSALYVQGPVLGAQTGAAISSGYVGETIVAENNAFVQTGMTNSTTVAFLNITLTPGVWLISASQTVAQNGSTGTAFSSTLSDVSTSGNTVTGIGLSVTDNNGWPPNNVTGLTITHPSFIYSTATSKTIYLNSFALFTAGTPSRKGTLRAIRLN
jgi:hypothetical protein